MGLFSKKEDTTLNATQVRNLLWKNDIYNTLSATEGYSAYDISKKLNITPQYVSALLHQMEKENNIFKMDNKGKRYFFKNPDCPPLNEQEVREKVNAQHEKSKSNNTIKSFEIVYDLDKPTIEELLIEQNKLLKAILEKL